MTAEYNPPISENSLLGDADPHKQVENAIKECDDADWKEEYFHNKHCEHAPNRKSRLQPWAVYVIKLHKPKQYAQLNSVAEDELGRPLRDYEKAAFYRDSVYYVGYTGHPYNRIENHVDREDSSEFLDLFPPYEFQEIEFLPEEIDAIQREKARAKELDESNSEFAYSDQLQWDHL